MDKLGVSIELILMLNRYKVLDTKRIRDEMGVSLRTAQRYMQELANLPMVIYDEEKNTCAMMEDAELKAFLSTSEISFLTALLQYAGRAMGKKDRDFLLKLSHKILHANSMASVYCMLDPDAVDPDQIAENRHILETAIQEQRKLKFHYTRWDKDYEVKPFRILFHEGFWYLLARHDKIIKKFALDHIVKPTIGIHHSDQAKDLPELLQDARNLWFRKVEQKTEVVVRVDKEIAEYFKRKVFFPGQEILETGNDGRLTLRFESYNREDMYNLVIRWIPHIEILKPNRYREFMKEQLETTLDKHK
jgi:predicted DNA-binding transcriptional regulator YafY